MKTLMVALIWALCGTATSHAGKPWRPAVEQLHKTSSLIVIGTVSATMDKDGNRYAMAEITVTEVLKGTPPKNLRVLTTYQAEVDADGNPALISTAFRYQLRMDGHQYLLLLNKAAADDAEYFEPAGQGSGIVDLNSKRVGDGPEELEKLRKALQGIGQNPSVR